jgi:hypothetical protein
MSVPAVPMTQRRDWRKETMSEAGARKDSSQIDRTKRHRGAAGTAGAGTDWLHAPARTSIRIAFSGNKKGTVDDHEEESKFFVGCGGGNL